MTKYQFEVDNELWEEWKETVPRSVSLDERIRELLLADAEGRVLEPDEAGTVAVLEPDKGREGRREAVQGLSVPGEGAVEDERREAVRAAYEHLKREGRAPKAELLEIGAGIAGETYESERSLWKNLLQRKLSELEDVEPVGGSGDWRVMD